MQVATKLFVIEQQKKQAERLQKVKHIYIYIYIYKKPIICYVRAL